MQSFLDGSVDVTDHAYQRLVAESSCDDGSSSSSGDDYAFAINRRTGEWVGQSQDDRPRGVRQRQRRKRRWLPGAESRDHELLRLESSNDSDSDDGFRFG